jgi:hypothetical protein
MQITLDRHGIPWVRHPIPRGEAAPSEHWEQTVFVRFARAKGYLVAAVPNGGKRGKREAERLRDEGVLPGWPDLIVITLDGAVMLVEMKRRQGGALSAEQRVVIGRLLHVGVNVAVCEGWEAAWNYVSGNAKP